MKKAKKLTISNLKVTIDDLAVMVKQGFDHLQSHVDGRFEKVGRELAELKSGQESIVLRLSNVAYRFELVDLEKRVDRLEHKTGLTKRLD